MRRLVLQTYMHDNIDNIDNILKQLLIESYLIWFFFLFYPSRALFQIVRKLNANNPFTFDMNKRVRQELSINFAPQLHGGCGHRHFCAFSELVGLNYCNKYNSKLLFQFAVLFNSDGTK